jgi:hypothetical protein
MRKKEGTSKIRLKDASASGISSTTYATWKKWFAIVWRAAGVIAFRTSSGQ